MNFMKLLAMHEIQDRPIVMPVFNRPPPLYLCITHNKKTPYVDDAYWKSGGAAFYACHALCAQHIKKVCRDGKFLPSPTHLN